MHLICENAATIKNVAYLKSKLNNLFNKFNTYCYFTLIYILQTNNKLDNIESQVMQYDLSCLSHSKFGSTNLQNDLMIYLSSYFRI